MPSVSLRRAPNQSEQKRSVLGHITHSQEQGPLQDNLVWASKESACQPRVSAPLGLPYDGSSSFNSMFLQHPVQWRTRECPFGSEWGYLPVPVPDPVAERGAVDWLHRQAESERVAADGRVGLGAGRHSAGISAH